MIASRSGSSNYTTPRQSPTGLSLDDTTIDFTFERDRSSMPSRNCLSASHSNCCLHSLQKLEDTLKAPVPTLFPPIASDTNRMATADDNDFLIMKFKELENEWVQLLAFERQLSIISTQLNCTRQRVKHTISEINARLERRRKEKVETKDIAVQADSFESNIESGRSFLPSLVSPRFLSSYSVVSESSTNIPFRNEEVPSSNECVTPNVDVSKVITIQAFARGNFIRQLMATFKVQEVIQTIRDTSILLEQYLSQPKTDVDVSDVLFHNALMTQMESSVVEFHDIFFVYSKAEQFELINRSREMLNEKNRRIRTFYDELSGRKSESDKMMQTPQKPRSARKAYVKKDLSDGESKNLQVPVRVPSKSAPVGKNVKSSKKQPTPIKVDKQQLVRSNKVRRNLPT